MKLEHFGMAEPGDCRLVFTAGAEELAAAVAQVQAEPDAPQEEDGLLTEAVNRTILDGFSALYEQLVDAVKGPLPKQLVGGNYFAEQRQFNLSLQANGINFDQFLKVRGQTVEEFRAWLHTQAERKLRSWLGLLLVAEKEGLAPTDAEVEAAAAHWDAKLDGERTFPANDARKVRQRLARERAEQFIVEHSTLTPPPDEPIVQKVESK